MSKILSKSAVFIAALALLAAPVAASAQVGPLSVVGGDGGIGGTTGGTQVTITPSVGIKDPTDAAWQAQLDGQSWSWTIDSDAQLAIFQNPTNGFNALNFRGGIGGAGNANQAADTDLRTGGKAGSIAFVLERNLTTILGASSFTAGAGGAGGAAADSSNKFGGNGNLGGAVDVMLNGLVEFSAALTLAGGAGGASGAADNDGKSGTGGEGGDLTFVIGENAAGAKIDSVDVTAGAAGNNGILTLGTLGAAGKGGDVYFTVNGATTIGAASFTATAGGASAAAAANQTSSDGAAGGNVEVELNAKTTSGALTLTAGAGGASGAGSGDATAKTGNGGAGGQVDFTIGSNAAGSTIVSVDARAGAGGASGLGEDGSDAGEGGNGGAVNFTVNGATTITGAASFTAGGGVISAEADAAVEVSGDTGNGGDVAIVLNAKTTTGGVLSLVGGNGGASGDASVAPTAETGAGGNGGQVKLDLTANAAGTVFKGLTVTGGAAGAKGSEAGGATSGIAGAGGDVIVNLDTDITIGDDGLTLTSGAGAATGTAAGGKVAFNAAGQTVTVTGATAISISSTNPATAGTVSFIADKFIAGGAVTLGGAATGTDAEKAAAFTFDVNELQFVGTTTSLAVTNATLPNSGQGGISIDTLTIGGVETYGAGVPTGQSIAPVAFTANAVAGTAYKFGGHLQVIGLGHSVVSAANLGTITDLTFVLSDNDYDGAIVLATGASDAVKLANNVNIVIATLESGLNSKMEVGDQFTLIDKIENAAADYASLERTVYTSGGLITDYAFDLFTVANGIVALEAEYRGEVLVEGAAHSVAMAAAAPSLLQMNGRDLAADLIDAGTLIGLTNSGNQIEMLFGLGAGFDRFELNSEIKSNHFNLNIGPALNLGLVGGTATIGAFFEAGWANYNIINENDLYPRAYNGDGKAHYFGGGVLAGVELTSGFHADASLAFGRVTNEFNPEWLDRAGFELKANYFGLHLSAGYLIAINETSGVDVYGKLLWNHQFKADATTSNGQLVQFAAFNSVRTVLGADYTLQLTPQASLSAGLAWEYQFETEQNIVIDNLVVTPANFKGHTGLLNLGLDVKASDNVSLGLGLQGALGQRNGFGGNLSLGFSF